MSQGCIITLALVLTDVLPVLVTVKFCKRISKYRFELLKSKPVIPKANIRFSLGEVLKS